MTPAATRPADRADAIPRIGFFFWPRDPQMVRQMGELAEEHGYDLVGVADSPGQALDCWVAATLLSAAAPSVPLTISVSNFASRHWTTSASAAASLAMAHAPGFTLGIGAGHSAVRNFGLHGSTVAQLAEGLSAARQLLRGQAVPTEFGEAQLPWVREVPRVFLAASHPRSLSLAGAAADGAIVNYGLRPENITESYGLVAQGAAGAPPEIWQAAALDCTEDPATAHAAIARICAFGAGYVIGRKDPAERGVPPEHVAAMRELVQLYSTRPSQADADLVARLGLGDYLRQRFAVCGDPDECLSQVRAAGRAGVQALLFSVGQASDPVKVIDTFGRFVLPALRAGEAKPDVHA